MKLHRLLDTPIAGGRLGCALWLLVWLAFYILWVMFPADFEPSSGGGGSDDIRIRHVPVVIYQTVPITRNDGRLD